MLMSLNDKGYNPLAMSIPSVEEFTIMVNLAGPVLLTMLSKVTHHVHLRLFLDPTITWFRLLILFKESVLIRKRKFL